MSDLQYQSGFGNEFAWEGEAGALPNRGNNPQRPALGLYAEQVSGSPFTSPNTQNQRSWLYKLRPSVTHSPFEQVADSRFSIEHAQFKSTPNQIRWSPRTHTPPKTDFVSGIFPYCRNGSAKSQAGVAIYGYFCNQPMVNSVFQCSDGDLMIVPQMGELSLRTEFGQLQIEPGEICVIQRGIKFQVNVGYAASGYLCENYGAHFDLPYRGPIGANGLANSRDFLTPTGSYIDNETPHQLFCKYGDSLFVASVPHSPFDVVAWHGNYTPYKYDLRNFNTMGSISFDHPDPSIFTVLTSQTAVPGTANVDFVIFPDRWMVAEDTFRPPYYHRNIMSEFMGLVYGDYDAKPGAGFQPGGASLHNCMAPHGPDVDAFLTATNAALKPTKQENTMAFMFESNLPFEVHVEALNHESRQKDYLSAWQGLPKLFKKP